VDSRHLRRVRRWAEDDVDALSLDARAAVTTALAAADSGGASAEDRSAALRWARTMARHGGTAAERSAARSIIALLDDSPGSRFLERRVGSAQSPAPSVEEADFPVKQPRARSARPRASARTIRRRRAVALGIVGLVALAVSTVAGARSVFAPSFDATGPPSGARIGSGALAKLAFSIGGAGEARWKLDGRNVSARVTRERRTQTFRPGKLADGEHRVEVKRRGGFLGASATHAWRFTVDTTPPSIRLDGPATAKPRRALVANGMVEPGSSIRVAGRPTAVDDGRFTVRIAPPLPRTLLLEAVDGAGNRATRRVPVEIVARRPPVPVRAVHVTFYGWADADLRRGVLKLIDQRRINAIEIDLKDESGDVGFDASVPLGHRIGAVKRIYDLDAIVKAMHARGVRVIGRLVCFRDPVFASAAWKRGQRDRVVRTADGGLYAGDYGGFTNFANPTVRKYNIDIAVAAARAGVDDVLYDYVRRPDGPRSSMVFPGLRGTPERSIVGFIHETRRALEPYGTYLGVSVFGVAATRPTEVAQAISALARESDYIAPMVYPSHWAPGEYNVAAPNNQPHEIVLRSLRDFVKQTHGTGARVVPWLQDFTLGVSYGEAEVRAQIRAARRAGIGEYLLWDPEVTYTAEALEPSARTSTQGLSEPATDQTAAPAATTEPRAKPKHAAQPQRIAGRLPNELGDVPVIMHHEIREDRVGEYDQTPAEFRAELELLWRQGYWPVRAAALATGRLGSVPAGRTPVVLTFDDSTQFQFSYDARGHIKPDTAIGILLAFRREHPTFPLAGTFYVNREPFAGAARGKQMLRWLVNHGFELGNHTKDHVPFSQLSGPVEVKRELVLGNEVIEDAVPGYRVETISLPLGVLPKPPALALRGRWNGRSYSFRGVMLVGAGPAPSPFSKSFDRAGIPRIRSGHLPWRGDADLGAWHWLRQLEQNPRRRYVSDGDPAAIAFPRALENSLRPRFRSRARAY
jgi:peptidoglycan/xylan/chitin deacetylase (PgdA/CDA1 family)